MALKYLLDTDTLSFVVSNRHPEVRKTFLEHAHESGISVITYAEALFGAQEESRQARVAHRRILRHD